MHCVRSVVNHLYSGPVQSVLAVIQTSYSMIILQYVCFEAHKLIFLFDFIFLH